MATGNTEVSDVIVPEQFTSYVQLLTEEKSRMIQSGVVSADAALNTFLSGGGITEHSPSWKDLDNDDDNVSSDTGADATPNKTGAVDEIVVRLSRNNHWSTSDLAAALAGSDPANSIANRVAGYWVRRAQTAFVATMNGIFADNDAAPIGTEHVQGDMTVDISGVGFVDGVTNFSAEAFIDATLTMGDSMESLGVVFMHSIVYGRAQKNNLIDFIPDARGEIMIATFLGREVIVDDGLPFAGGVFQTWLFGIGAVRMGNGSPKVGTEIERNPLANNGGGEEVLTNRLEWVFHPVGNAYVGTPANGGPSNANTANNLANLDSWQRVFTERKQIKIARLITREF